MSGASGYGCSYGESPGNVCDGNTVNNIQGGEDSETKRGRVTAGGRLMVDSGGLSL